MSAPTANDTPIAHCACCDTSYTHDDFLALAKPTSGRDLAPDGEGGWLVYRNCTCKSTITAPRVRGKGVTMYRIANRSSGGLLGLYAGTDADAALDAMARDAGYADFADSCKALGQAVDVAWADLDIAPVGPL